MKKILILLLITVTFVSCKNQDWEFDDFDYTTTYFSFQYPVRTLVLGDYNFDNTNDNNHRFVISAAMGGAYNNNSDRVVSFVIDPTLVDKLYTGATKLKILPQNYYTLSDNEKIIIPKGSFTGGITVQLTDDFFSDTLAVATNYVIPLRIISSTTDSVLRGLPATGVTSPDPRIAGNWIKVPKDFTLFGIKFVNEYHGKYLLRGRDIVKRGSDNAILDTIVFRRQYVEQDEIVMLSTSGKKTIAYTNSVRNKKKSPGKFNVTITFDGENNCTIKHANGFVVNGNGKFVKNADQWGGEKRHALYLSYTIVAPGDSVHHVNDTLVFRDKAVAIQEFSPTIK